MKEILDWLKDETESPFIDQDVVNGIMDRFRVSEKAAKEYLDTFLMNNPNRVDNKTVYDPTIHELIDYQKLHERKPKPKSYMTCRNCRKELENLDTEYCSVECEKTYINNVILFWKPSVMKESEIGQKEIPILQTESRLAFMNLVRDAEPEELRLRIKILKSVVQHAIELAYDKLSRDKLQAEVDEELSLKGVSKKLAEERDRARIENTELKREIEKIKKESGWKGVNKEVREGAKTGHCRVCGVETLKETCSADHSAQWKAIQGWIKMGFTEEKARETIKLINARATESGPN